MAVLPLHGFFSWDLAAQVQKIHQLFRELDSEPARVVVQFRRGTGSKDRSFFIFSFMKVS